MDWVEKFGMVWESVVLGISEEVVLGSAVDSGGVGAISGVD